MAMFAKLSWVSLKRKFLTSLLGRHAWSLGRRARSRPYVQNDNCIWSSRFFCFFVGLGSIQLCSSALFCAILAQRYGSVTGQHLSMPSCLLVHSHVLSIPSTQCLDLYGNWYSSIAKRTFCKGNRKWRE